MTNSGYTAPAQQLASTNGILLLHYRDLSKLDELLNTGRSVNGDLIQAVRDETTVITSQAASAQN